MTKLVLGFLALSLTACSAAKQSAISSSADNAAIIGGEIVSADDSIAKSTVALVDIFQGGACTGTLLKNNVVLTAAHCVQNGPEVLRVYFGVDLKTAQAFAVKEAKPHSRYMEAMTELEKVLQSVIDTTVPGDDRQKKLFTAMDEYKNWGDIALVKFEGEAPAGYVAAEVLEDGRYVQNGGTITLAGYGITKPYSQQKPDEVEEDVLRKVDIKIANAIFAETEVSFDQTEGRGACHGDSGGPAYVKVGDKLKLFGITSRGLNDPEDSCGQLAGYTYLPAYLNWVSETMAAFEKQPEAGN